jgi:RNA polymerase sigma-70 factor (ECF subfamily)
LDDSIIIEGLKQRDKIVFDYVFNYYYSSLCLFALKYLDNRDEVEDLVQDFFVSLWVEAPRFQIKNSLKSYLFTSIKNRCLDYHRHQKITKKYRDFALFSKDYYVESNEIYFAESELRQAIQISMAKLPPRRREIFELNRLEGLSNQEISDKLGISKRTVELQISNTLKILRTDLSEFIPVFILFWLLS